MNLADKLTLIVTSCLIITRANCFGYPTLDNDLDIVPAYGANSTCIDYDNYDAD